MVRRTMSPKLRSRVRVLSNYGELTDEIDAEQLLPEVRLMFISDLAFSDLHSLRNNRDLVCAPFGSGLRTCTVCATIENISVCDRSLTPNAFLARRPPAP